MKKLFILKFLLCFLIGYSQSVNFRAISSGFSPITEDYYFPKMQEDSSIIVFEIKNKKITVYNNEIQMMFNIYKFYDVKTDENGNEIMQFDTIDQDGNRTEIFFIEYKSLKFEKVVNLNFTHQLVILTKPAYLLFNMNEINN